MGYIVGTSCVITLEAAHNLYYGSIPHAFSHDATYTYETQYVQSATVGRSSASGWSRQTVQYPNGGGAAVATVYVDLGSQTFPECDPAESFLDGVTVGWGLGAALIMAACFKLMSRGAR